MTPETGQLWTFPETDDAPPLLVTIGTIDNAESLGADAANPAVLSVSLVPVDEARELGWPNVDHCPVSQASFTGGEFVMDDVSPAMGFDEGYGVWREAFDAGNAGVFSLSPSAAYAEIVRLYAEQD